MTVSLRLFSSRRPSGSSIRRLAAHPSSTRNRLVQLGLRVWALAQQPPQLQRKRSAQRAGQAGPLRPRGAAFQEQLVLIAFSPPGGVAACRYQRCRRILLRRGRGRRVEHLPRDARVAPARWVGVCRAQDVIQDGGLGWVFSALL